MTVLAAAVLIALSACAAATENVVRLIARLDPLTASVVSNFVNLTDIPRPTYHEKAVSDALVAWAEARGFAPTQDAKNNVWFDVPATAGMEAVPLTILQGHMDMVAAGFADPPNEPVTLDCDADGNVFSQGRATSIGADDGIGIAMTLTVAEGKVPHGPLRVLVTTDEEKSQTGAVAVPDSVFADARYCINVDYETDGEMTISSAACEMLSATGTVETTEATLADAYRIGIDGFRGGHSGIDIDKGRLNAILVLGHLLTNAVARGISFELAEMTGGDADNAIPPHATALVKMNESGRAAFEDLLKETEDACKRLGETDASFTLLKAAEGSDRVFSAEAQAKLLAYLTTVHDGVWNMSEAVPGLVETSVNLGRIAASAAGVSIRGSARGSVGETLLAEETALRAAAAQSGYSLAFDRTCAPWPASPANPLTAVMAKAWKEVTGGTMKTVAVHAGLECGWFAQKAPALHLVSVGPTIAGAHTVNETFCVASVSNVIRLVAQTLATLPVDGVPFPAERTGVCSWSWATNMTTILDQMDTMGVKCLQLSLVPWVRPLYGIEYDASLRETFGKGETGDVFASISNRIAKGEISVLSTMISFPFDRWGGYQAISNSNGIVCNIATNDPLGTATCADDPLGEAAWTVNSNLVDQAAARTAQLGVAYLSSSVGFLLKPMVDRGVDLNENGEVGFARLYACQRICSHYGVRLLLETGQYSGEATMAMLDAYTNRYAGAELENGMTVDEIALNFDSANHLIYENDTPTNAFAVMRSRIPQVHVKDTYGTRADREKAGGFAVDVKWGLADVSGKYDTLAFLKREGFRGNLLVEHESGDDRVGDINAALRAILLANNDDPSDPWISPAAMTGEAPGARCEAALKAQGFGADVAGALADPGLYASFRSWADSKGLDPSGLAAKEGVILAAACDAPAVADPAEVTLAVTNLMVDAVSADGLMTFEIAVEGYDPARIDENLLKAALGVEGTADLQSATFSPDALDFWFGTVTEGRLPVTVVPKKVEEETLGRFFIRATAR